MLHYDILVYNLEFPMRSTIWSVTNCTCSAICSQKFGNILFFYKTEICTYTIHTDSLHEISMYRTVDNCTVFILFVSYLYAWWWLSWAETCSSLLTVI